MSRRRRRIGPLAWPLAGLLFTPIVALWAVTNGRLGSMRWEVPLKYAEDGLGHLVLLQSLIEGDPFTSDRLGYPFGANWLDFPGLDWGIVAIARALALFTADQAVLFNLLFIVGFPAAYLSAHLVARRFGLPASLSFFIGFAFALAPYHFARLAMDGHLFLTWYWTVPCFVLLAWRVAAPPTGTGRHQVLAWLGTAALAGFGVYYTAFGLLGIAAALVLGLIEGGGRRSVGMAARYGSALAIGVIVQALPVWLHLREIGPNPLSLIRSAAEADAFGFRLIQLLLPSPWHRSEAFAAPAQNFQDVVVGNNETVTASLGLLASVGLVLGLLLVITAALQKSVEPRTRHLGIMTLLFTALGSKGGLGLIIAMAATPYIRSWNRVSIVLAYLALLLLGLALTPTLARRPGRHGSVVALALVATMGTVVVLDQTPAPCPVCRQNTAAAHDRAAVFTSAVEASLPAGAAIYQMPFVSYPEGRTAVGDRYGFTTLYLESRGLRSNLGGMRGRAADTFYRTLARRSVATQVEVAARLGFDGIWVDRTLYADGGTRVLRELDVVVGIAQRTMRADGHVAFYRLAPAGETVQEPLSLPEAIAMSGFMPTTPPPPRGD